MTDQVLWWRDYSLESGQSAAGQIGPLRLAVERLEHEWRLHYEMLAEGPDNSVNEPLAPVTELTPAYPVTERFAFKNTNPTLSVAPALADRPVVTRPLLPLNLPGGEEATLYVSTPVWLQISLNRNDKVLKEIPVQRASDTWFGPSTREGELCYASRTRAFLDPAELPRQFHRATTPIRIQNNAASPLLLERISLPVPFLSLYIGDDGFLWTESVTMSRDSDGDLASLHINKGKPLPALGMRQINKPRHDSGRSVLVRAFSSLFGE